MKQINPTEARQGREGRPVLIVLVVSILAALAVWAVVEIYGAMISPGDDASNGANSVPPATTESVPPASAE